jgi:hypothetical protein
MSRLRTPLGALALCLLLPGLAVAQPAQEEPFATGSLIEEIDPEMEAEAPASGLETDLDVVDRAHAAYLADGELQLERPEEDIDLPEPSPPPGWLRAFGAFLESLGPLFQVIFWIAAGLVVAGLLYFLFGEAIRMRFGGKRAPVEMRTDDVLADLRPDAAAARSLLEEADALAQAGRFAEAVHLLLFRSIEDLQARIEGGVPTSLTAREIAALGKLPERAKRGLKPIIQVVERSFFGGRPVDAGGWQEARRSYEDFAFGEAWA